MSTHRVWLVLALLLFALVVRPTVAAEKEPRLTVEDKKYLDSLMKEFLFDPQGAERVRVKTVVRTVWASAGETTAEGWLCPGKDGKPGQVYFTDGAWIPAPPEKDIKRVDFKAACQARYAATPKKKDAKEDDDLPKSFRQMQQAAVGEVGSDDLALAAWLYRLGEDRLAAQALAAARKGEGDPRQRLRGELAWSAFASMIHAYMVRADEEALAHGERLLRLYPEEAKSRDYKQAAQVVEELKRRQKQGTFGKAPPEKWPEGFDKWDSHKKSSYLIEALEEVDARQRGQPGGVDLARDGRVEALIRLGDPAVLDLLDALEKDERLTRSVHFWRDFAQSRTVLSVREAVLTALMSILRVRVFEPASTGDNFTARGDEAAKDMARRLRAYWKEYGPLPFDERMMKVLTDPKTNFEAKREAAENLATLNDDRRLQTTIYPTVIGAAPPPEPKQLHKKFSKPTVAEAILDAMDADLAVHDTTPAKDAGYHDYERRGIEGTYLSALVELGDKRIAPELARRAAAAPKLRARRQWAHAAHFLGDPKPLATLAEEFRAGKLVLPAGEDGEQELEGILHALINVETPEALRAIDALTDPKHPQHKAATHKVLTQRPDGSERGPWFAHPFCLRILRTALEDTTPTGAKFVMEKDMLWRREKDGGSGGPVPQFLADPATRREQAEERACDAAALKLGDLVLGLPRYHPLQKDADQRLAALKTMLDRFAGSYRRANWREVRRLDLSHFAPTYVPDIRPLGRAATADDVKAGKAIFHLDGKGKPADLKLPAAAVLKGVAKEKWPHHVLIVQAEVGPDGAVTCGIITHEEIRTVPMHQLVDVKSFADLQKEESESAGKKGQKR
jgi:hypothetical protein